MVSTSRLLWVAVSTCPTGSTAMRSRLFAALFSIAKTVVALSFFEIVHVAFNPRFLKGHCSLR